MRRCEVDRLDPRRTYWVPAVASPERDWPGFPGCHRGARFLVDRDTMHASRDVFETFDTRASCLGWIMEHRADLNRTLPGATVRAVALDRWLLGLD
jgi:hypothetical protein